MAIIPMVLPDSPEPATTSGATRHRIYAIAAFVLLVYAAGAWAGRLRRIQQNPMSFDDAYMFARYAYNLRHGLGFAWNPDGIPTYGPTSLLWTAVVFVFSFLPLGDWAMLTLASWLCSIGAVWALTVVITQNARTPFLQSKWRVLPLVVIPLCWPPAFAANSITGMETMLAVLLLTLFLGACLRWLRGETTPFAPAIWGLFTILTRPEAAAPVLLFPVCAFFLLRQDRRAALPSLVTLLGAICASLALELALCRAYFGTLFPLSLYMKGHAAYAGYADVWYADQLLFSFFAGFIVFLVAIIAIVRRKDARLLLAFFLPFAVVCGYLLTVTQIMGFFSRYYAPYLPFLVIPVFLMADRWIADRLPGDNWIRLISYSRIALALLLVGFFSVAMMQRNQRRMRLLENRHHIEYEPIQFTIAASKHLQTGDWSAPAKHISEELVAPLPAGAVVAATEVGYLGAVAPQVYVIDLAGLNDNQIALHGFTVDDLMARHPDVIWLPHIDYTWQRGIIASDPRFLQRYDVYADAANYGIALRKDSPFRPAIDKAFARFWAVSYGDLPMQDYHASAVYWSGRKILVGPK